MFLSLILMFLMIKAFRPNWHYALRPLSQNVIVRLVFIMFCATVWAEGAEKPWPGNSWREPSVMRQKRSFLLPSEAEISRSIKSYFQLLKICFSSLFILFLMLSEKEQLAVGKLFILKWQKLSLSLSPCSGRTQGVNATSPSLYSGAKSN